MTASPVPPGDAASSDKVVVSSADDLGSLSRWIVRRTTDLILISLIVVAGLTVARRLIVWWKVEPEDLRADLQMVYAADALAPWGLGPGGVAIDLGELPLTLHRESLSGSLDQALLQLRAACRRTLVSADSAIIRGLPPLPEAETRLLGQLQAQSPVESAPGGEWRLHEIPGPPAMILGVRRGEPPDTPDRVICWGLVLPIETNLWSVLRVTPRQETSGPVITGEWPLPSGCRRGLALRDPQGGGLITFSGEGPPEAWRGEFDRFAQARGWVALAGWRTESAVWSATWTTGAERPALRLDLQFHRTDAGWTGLLNATPTRSQDPS